ncbi:TonB-dependent receptor plug domain-containing protein [Alteromonas halophila]|uniref:TonB-dependent receptor n=1 Tax=Alteromonas halophila TaxID=516698 RepID=A0A918JHC9_9ALTE|nr:TonB-dependent receptor [Alteromonas halophila]GGW80317.1 TonB-dependent receptor [Alteromonas halophila]
MTNTTFYKAAGIAALAGCAFLQPAIAAPTESHFEHITVNGSRLALPGAQLAAARTLLTREDITASGAIQVTDLLRGLPGVSIAQSGSPGALTEIRLRGSESNHLLVLIDGVVANDIGQGSLLDLAHLTTANIASIELLRGPQSALWGSGAIGGVLSITTLSASTEDGQTHVSGRVGAGSRNTTQAALNVATGNDELAFRGYLNRFETDGDNVARTGTEDDGYENLTAGAAFSYALSPEHAFDWRLRYTDYQNDYDSIDSVNTGLPADSDNVTDGTQLTSNVRWRYTPVNSDYSGELSWQYHQDKNDNRVAQADAGGTTGRRQQLTWLNRYDVSDTWQVAAGLDYQRREFEQRGPVNFGDPNQTRHDTTRALFAEVAGSPVTDWHTSLSARYDDNSEYDDAVSYRAGLTWDVSRATALFVSVGQAVKTPTFTERFGYFPGSFVGNPDLNVETSREWEVGVRTQVSDTDISISAFDTTLTDEILGYVFVPALGSATAQNARFDSHRRGLEGSLDYATSLATLRVSYTYLDADEQSGNSTLAELRRARHQGALSLRSDLGVEKLSTYLKLSYTGSRQDMFYPPYPQSARRIALRPYTLASVNIRYTLSPAWQLALRIDNALDTDYEDIVGYAGERRRARLTLSYTL